MLTRLRSGSDPSLDLKRAVKRALTITLLSALLTACGAPPQTQAPQEPATSVPQGQLGLKTRSAEITPTAEAVAEMARLATDAGLDFFTLTHDESPMAALVKVDLKRFRPHVVADPKGLVPAKVIAGDRVALVIGSSFVSQVRQMQPIGVLLTNGQLLQNVEQHGYTRILGIVNAGSENGDRFQVVHRSEWPVERFHSALQAGPGIVEKGALDVSERDLQRSKYFRSFVAECGDQSVVGATVVPVHLYTLGSELVQFFAQQQLACSEVVNLAGDREAVLLVRDGESAAFLGDPDPPRAGLITFTEIP